MTMREFEKQVRIYYHHHLCPTKPAHDDCAISLDNINRYDQWLEVLRGIGVVK